MTNDRKGTCEHTSQLQLKIWTDFSVFPFSPHAMSLYIDMKMTLSLNCSGSHCRSLIRLWIFTRRPNFVIPGNILHSNSVGIPSMRLSSLKWLFSEYHLFFVFPSCNRIISHLSHTENHHTYCLIILKDVQHSIGTRMFPPDGTWSISVRPRLVFVVGICFRMFCWRFAGRVLRGSLTSLVLLVWFDLVRNVWEIWYAGFRHCAGLHARVIFDCATCRLRELGDVRCTECSRCVVG